MIRKNSREQFLEIVNAHLSLREQAKKHDPAMVKVAEGIKEGRLQLADSSYYAIKYGGDKATIHMFETQDAKEIGVTNVTQSKLPKDRLFLCNRITLLAKVFEGEIPQSDTAWKQLIKSTNFDSIKTVAGLQNGVWTFMANKKIIVDERPMQEFVTDNNMQINLGTYYLENPRFVRDDEEFEFMIELGDDAPDKTLVKVLLSGTSTVPA